MASDPKARAVGDARRADTRRALELLVTRLDCDTFADAARCGRLWVALAGDVPVGFALVQMLADQSPPSRRTRRRTRARSTWARDRARSGGLRMGDGLRLLDADADDVQRRALEPAVLCASRICGSPTRPASSRAGTGRVQGSGSRSRARDTRCHGPSMRVVRDLTTMSGARAIAGPGARHSSHRVVSFPSNPSLLR